MPRLFAPLLAGATFRDRVVACLGALFGISMTSAVSAWWLGGWADLPLLVAPMGASAVLVFAVPASPLAQPWPVVGGNILSAIVGITVAQLVPVPHLAAGLAVAAAILVMSLARCLHPPGGAAALTVVIGGPAVTSAGYLFAFVPIGVNAVLLAAAGIAFHRLSRHSYPHRPAPAPVAPTDEAAGITGEDIDRALAELDEAYDVGRDDLLPLFQRAAHYRAERLARARR